MIGHGTAPGAMDSFSLMHIQNHQLISPTLGTARQITSFHYGTPGTGQKVYIQASLHADELPGMLVAWALRRKLAELEAAGKIRGEIVVVPVANPIGLNQQWLGQMTGRFEANSAQNFNRHFHDLTTLLDMPDVAAHLTQDIDANRTAIRASMGSALQLQRPQTELASQRLTLQLLSFDADVMLDLHCDREAAMHLYTHPDLWPEVEPLARYVGAKASLLAENSMGNPFDEVHSYCWSELRKHYGDRFPIPSGTVSVTLELRGQRDVSYAFAEEDAQAILHYLTHRNIVDAPAAPMPALAFPATPLSGSETIVAPVSGILVFHVGFGDWVEAGTAVADIVDPLTDRVVTVSCTVSGVVYARHGARFAPVGMELALIAGKMPIKTGSLLSQ